MALRALQTGTAKSHPTQHVLRCLKRAAKPLGAYEVQAETGIRHPVTIYRALRSLSEQGLVHRVVSLNEFIACGAPGETHASGFMICDVCGAVEEFVAEPIRKLLSANVQTGQFLMEKLTVEISGQCRRCSATETRVGTPQPSHSAIGIGQKLKVFSKGT